MKRITPAEVQQAYEATGLTPVNDEFFLFADEDAVEPCAACALGALYVAAGNEMPNDQLLAEEAANQWAKETYGDNYVGGFLRGFDGHGIGFLNGNRCQEGHSDGQAVRAATTFATEVSRA